MATDRFNSFSPAGKPFYADDFSMSEVVGQYDSFFKLGLTDEEKRDLIQDLLAAPATGSKESTSGRETEEPVNPGGWS
jgi:hypothetical protein